MRRTTLWVLGFVGGVVLGAALVLLSPVRVLDVFPPRLEPIGKDPFGRLVKAGRDACHEPHPARFYDLRPNCRIERDHLEASRIVYQWNDCRVRDETGCGPRPPGTVRILALGDSMTMGGVVEAAGAYPAVLERYLRETAHAPVEVYNRGVSGYNLYQSVLLAREAARYDAQIVLLAITPNDLFDDLSPARLADWDREARRRFASPSPTSTLGFRLTLPNELKSLLAHGRLVLWLQQLAFKSDRLYVEAYLRRGAAWLKPPLDGRWRARLAHVERLLADLHRDLAGEGRKLVVFLIPQRIQSLLISTAAKPPYDPYLLHGALKAIGERHGIPVIDSLDALARYPRPGELYYPLDGHLVADGYRLVGEHLGAELLHRDIIKFDRSVVYRRGRLSRDEDG